MHEKKQGKFFDGFFWGAAIGGGLAYMLSTKKGRDFLKDLIQDGMDALENATAPDKTVMEEMPIMEEETVIEEVLAESPEGEAPVEMKEEAKVAPEHVSPETKPHTEEKATKKSRFFKKSPKK